MAEWIKVAEESSFRYSKAVDCKGHAMALFRIDDGIFALDDICSHEYSRLSEGEVYNGDVYCEKHGSRFDIKTGKVKNPPATKRVKAYPVKVENGEVYVKY